MDLGWFEVGINTADLPRSLAFYQMIGFEIVDGGPDIRTVTVQKDDCRIALYQGYSDGPLYLQFRQGDIEAIAADLSAKGIVFESGPGRDEHGTILLLNDPDGVPLVFINLKTPYFKDPAYAREAPLHRTGAPHYPPSGPGLKLGWFEASLAVEDIATSVAFYRKLGFDVVDDSVERNVTLQNNDCRLSLYQGYLDPARTQLIFWQGDVEAIRRDLSAKGLRFERGPAKGDYSGTGALLLDPDGTPLYFVNMPGAVRHETGH